MQAIQTKYLCPTNSRGARIKATCAAGSITISYPHELSGQTVHRKAAEALVSKLNWNDLPALLGGCLPDGSYCFVFKAKFSEE
jgi:hypothetical protein